MLMSLANVSIVGNIVKMPEQMFFASGRVKTTLIVAVNSPSRVNRASAGAEGNEGTADFYKVETWGKLAELAASYLNKGNQVTATGRLILDHWTDKQGRNRITPIVEANQIAFPQRAKMPSNEAPEGATISGEIDLSDQGGIQPDADNHFDPEDLNPQPLETQSPMDSMPRERKGSFRSTSKSRPVEATVS